MPTDLLEAVHIAELDEESNNLLQPYLREMAELVRTKQVNLHSSREKLQAEWHESQLDDKKVYVAIA
jgi:hypothetical protein